MADLSRIEFTLPPPAAEEAAGLLADLAPQGWEETEVPQGVQFCIHLQEHPMAVEVMRRIDERWPMAEPKLSQAESCDWSAAWKEFFNPIACGERFEIVPPWLAEQADDGLTTIIIEPRMAFGTGHHPTTALCLEAMADLVREGRLQPGQRFLDLGTGSGILGVGLVKLGLEGIGVDIDPQAVACAACNLEINRADHAMTLAVGGLECLEPSARFDCIAANILSKPLADMAERLVAHLAESGRLILSGVLIEQAPEVREAYQGAGLGEPRQIQQGEWCALVY
jgi:ribosomal protein L11 methyltransferase